MQCIDNLIKALRNKDCESVLGLMILLTLAPITPSKKKLAGELVRMSADKKSFEEIADWIEGHREELINEG